MTAYSPRVSVIVNNYNYGRFVGEAIDSALDQTYANVEVIAVDDGSTDNSRDVIAQYGRRVIPIFQENGGQASAFNAGFAASRGEVIIFLDADDTLLPTAVDHAVERFAPGVAKVYWPLWEMDADSCLSGAKIPASPLPEGSLREKILLHGPVACAEVPTSGNAWARHFLDKVLPMPKAQFRINADCYLSTLAAIYGDARLVEEPQARYRVHGDNRYVLMAVGEKSRRQFEMYGVRCDLLATHLTALGMEIDPGVWKEGNWSYEYLRRVSAATDEISSLVPPSGRMIMIDDGLWGDGRAGSAAIPDRVVIPFLEHDGYYNGRPADDDDAISELARLVAAERPDFLVVVWLGFWWLDCYAGFARHLRARFPCVAENERVIVFNLEGR